MDLALIQEKNSGEDTMKISFIIQIRVPLRNKHLHLFKLNNLQFKSSTFILVMTSLILPDRLSEICLPITTVCRSTLPLTQLSFTLSEFHSSRKQIPCQKRTTRSDFPDFTVCHSVYFIYKRDVRQTFNLLLNRRGEWPFKWSRC